MPQIGRKIYYLLSNGNVICTTSEMQGYVVETTIEHDFEAYIALQPYQQNAIGCLQLAYGEDATYFQQNYSYSIDITQNQPVIKWGSPPTVTLAQSQATQKQILQQGYVQTLAGGFLSSATGTSTTYGWTSLDQQHMQQLRDAIKDGLEVFPIMDYADINGNTVTLSTQSQFTQLETDAKNFNMAQLKQLRSLIAQVVSATDTSAVNAVQWSAATYTHS